MLKIIYPLEVQQQQRQGQAQFQLYISLYFTLFHHAVTVAERFLNWHSRKWMDMEIGELGFRIWRMPQCTGRVQSTVVEFGEEKFEIDFFSIFVYICSRCLWGDASLAKSDILMCSLRHPPQSYLLYRMLPSVEAHPLMITSGLVSCLTRV
ncbi:hypothetical protein GQ457_06G021040 [Hibiscus cannabinus]